MIKHVGKHNQRKIAIVYKYIPEEEHMALIVYTDSLPQMIHDEAMKCLESAVGQNAKELADALFRTIMADGQNCLTAMHRGGWLKKVPTNQVVVTPTSQSTIRLDELNKMLKEMEAGEEAKQRMADIDSNRGVKGVLSEGREVGEPVKTSVSGVNTSNEALSDADLAKQRLDQAVRMETEAKSLLAEAKRLKEEAKTLTPAKKTTNVRKTTTTKKATA
jgi:prefoldin subunit 5